MKLYGFLHCHSEPAVAGEESEWQIISSMTLPNGAGIICAPLGGHHARTDLASHRHRRYHRQPALAERSRPQSPGESPANGKARQDRGAELAESRAHRHSDLTA